jgi:hypothetical protein
MRAVILYISQISGGPEVAGSRIDRMIARLIRLRGPIVEPEGHTASLDIEFHVPGSILDPEHTGVRTGRLSKKHKLLAVQVGVPREILDKEEHEMAAFLLSALREAVRVATPIFQRANMPYAADEYLSLVDRIDHGMRH